MRAGVATRSLVHAHARPRLMVTESSKSPTKTGRVRLLKRQARCILTFSLSLTFQDPSLVKHAAWMVTTFRF